MKIEATIGSDGKITRKVDFEGATLPDGRNIDEILGENENLKKNVIDLKNEIEETSSILVRLIPNKTLRSVIEIVLIIGTIWGIIVLF